MRSLLPWEAREALSPATVDERLAPGAADEGWHIIPKVHGTRKTLSYIYVAPCGVRFAACRLHVTLCMMAARKR